MTRFLFDTGIAGCFINRRKRVFERAKHEILRGHRIGICTPGLCELRYGAEASANPIRNQQRLQLSLSELAVWPLTNEAAREYGRLAAFLKRTGRPMQQIDIQIAAIALTLGSCVVVSTDSDLSSIPGLTVENWAV